MTESQSTKPDWKVWRFEQMVTNVNVRIDNPSESGMEHYVGLEHLDPDSLRIRRWGSPDDVEATKLCFKKGDIIFGRRRAYQRKLGVAEFDGICSAHAMVLRAKPEVVLPEFLPFFMQSDLFMNRAVEISVGSLSPTINWKTMAVQEFALPPIEDQKRILLGLGAFEMALVEQDRLYEKANSAYQAYLMTWWTEDRGDKRRLGDVSLVSGAYGINASAKTYSRGEPRYIRITDIDDDGQLITSDQVSVDSKDSSAYLLQDGDLLIARTGNTVGKSFLYSDSDGPAVYAGYLVKFKFNSSIALPKYVFYITRTGQYRDWVKSSVRIGAQPNINAKEYSNLEIPIPCIDKQEELVSIADKLQAAKVSCKKRMNELRELKSSFISAEVVHGV